MSRSAPTLAAGLLCLALGGCALAAGSRPPDTFDLVAPRSFVAAHKAASWQLVVSEPTAIHALETELDAAKVKWQTVMWSGAVHSFCDPEANAGPTRYDPALAAQSYKLTHEFFARIF